MKKIAIALNLDWPLRRYHEIYFGIQAYAIQNTDWGIIWDHFPELILSKNEIEPYYAGIIGRIKDDTAKQAAKMGIPVVNLWYSSYLKELPSVFVDHPKSFTMACEHLIERGYRNFAYFDHHLNKDFKDFYNDYSAQLRKKGFKIKKYFLKNSIPEKGSEWNTYSLNFEKWLKEWEFPIGIICSSSPIGQQIIAKLNSNDCEVPRDAAVISAEEDPAYCEISSPQISSVVRDYYKVGFESARMLHKQMKGEKITNSPLMIPPIVTVSRESTDHYIFENDDLIEALSFIKQNFFQGINVTDVVANSDVSRRSLENLFRNNLNHSILDHINSLKVSRAKKLLLETTMDMSEISTECGFSRTNHFRGVFQRFYGMSPIQFKEESKISFDNLSPDIPLPQ